MLEVINKTRNTSLGKEIELAKSFQKRFLGLMFKDNLKENQGLFFPQCKSVHTFGMKFPIDILVLTKNNQVLHTFPRVPSFRIIRPRISAHSILEIPEGIIQNSKTIPGDQLLMRNL